MNTQTPRPGLHLLLGAVLGLIIGVVTSALVAVTLHELRNCPSELLDGKVCAVSGTVSKDGDGWSIMLNIPYQGNTRKLLARVELAPLRPLRTVRTGRAYFMLSETSPQSVARGDFSLLPAIEDSLEPTTRPKKRSKR